MSPEKEERLVKCLEDLVAMSLEYQKTNLAFQKATLEFQKYMAEKSMAEVTKLLKQATPPPEPWQEGAP